MGLGVETPLESLGVGLRVCECEILGILNPPDESSSITIRRISGPNLEDRDYQNPPSLNPKP